MNTSLVDSDLDLEGEITAGEFCPNGLLIVGLSNGFCLVLTYNCFSRVIEILTKVDCRNKKGPKSKGRPITGLDFVSEDLFLVTTKDSRIRLFSTENYEIKQKYKGLKNEHSKLVASVGKYSMHVICGSENGNVYI